MRGLWGNQSQRGGYVTMEAVTGMILIEEGEGATCQCKWPLEAKKGKETNFPLEPPEESLPTDILTLKPRKTNFGLLASITIRGYLCVVFRQTVCDNLLWQQQETHTPALP